MTAAGQIRDGGGSDAVQDSGHPWKKELIQFFRWMILGLLGEGRYQGDFKSTVLNNGA